MNEEAGLNVRYEQCPLKDLFELHALGIQHVEHFLVPVAGQGGNDHQRVVLPEK